jgi:hypothetical protein
VLLCRACVCVWQSNKVVAWFWETVREFNEEQRARLLQFSTGTSGVPAQGFSHLQVRGDVDWPGPLSVHGGSMQHHVTWRLSTPATQGEGL